MEQPQYNMFHRERVEREYERLYAELGIGTTIWSPLASGLLTGKYDDGMPAGTRASLPGLEWLREELVGPSAKPKIEKGKRLARVAAELGCTRAQLAIAWCLKHPHVSSAITGATRVEHVRENLKALDVLPTLTPEVTGTIETILGNAPSRTHRAE
jgi:aryl-alcohol dehydrogenase-like predicted oxidoreductase